MPATEKSTTLTTPAGMAFGPRPVLTRLPAERRDVPARKALVRRVRDEYEEMPGLSLTRAQAARLFGIPEDACGRILQELIEKRVLGWSRTGRYVCAAVER